MEKKKIKKHELLRARLEEICRAHSAEIEALPRSGPRGGNNAANIPGWAHCPHGTISRWIPVSMPYWSGSNPTPATAIPVCVLDEAIDAYKALYCSEDRGGDEKSCC